MKHSEYVETIKGLATKTGKDLLIREGAKMVPFLFTGPFGFIGTMLAGKVMEILIREGEFAAFFKYMDLRSDSLAKGFEAAMLYNHKMQQEGTDEQKKDAEKKLEDALRAFISLKN